MTAQLGTLRDGQHLLAALDYDTACAQRLWLTVIATTLADALAGDDELHRGSGASTMGRPLAREREEARHALTAPAGRKEREALCVLAGLASGFLCSFGRDLAASAWDGPPGLRDGIRSALSHGQRAEQLAAASAGFAAVGTPGARRGRCARIDTRR
ncbi:hypothetical protein [Falsiroseomonas oryzae]|uniref:hypothetical protein n=1 Tax=Falsiroseomonas oryzae TaxID=2766473 RepID=UPI0022EA17A6|nr:hypothetical protein [Roseomonas sp. MO-31]